MNRGKSLLLALLLVLPGSVGFSQSTPPPPTGIGPPPISDIDRLNRERDALKRRTDTMATLRLSYRSSGELTSSLEKTNPQALFIRAEVNGTPIKKLAKSDKPKIAQGVEQGLIKVEATWSRPGTRIRTICVAELEVGFQQAVILPYGGDENFSCEILPRSVSDETLEEWKKSLKVEEGRLVADCTSAHGIGSAGFWICVDHAGLPLPSA